MLPKGEATKFCFADVRGCLGDLPREGLRCITISNAGYTGLRAP